VHVDPGGRAECELKIRNSGTIVDQFTFEPLGDAAPWVSFQPATLSLFPGADATTRVVIAVPQTSEAKAGPCPVGVRVISKEDPAGTTVEEFTLDIGRSTNITIELVPRTGRGSRRAVYQLAVDNRGNDRLNADLSASDPDDQLGFAINPPAIVVEPGMAGFARIVAAPRNRFMRGPNVTHQFSAYATPEGGAPLAANGTMLQEATIPAWAPRALLGLLAAALVLGLLTLTVLRPTIRSAAREAANDEVSPALIEASRQIANLASKIPGATTPPPLTDSLGGDAGGDDGGDGDGGDGSGDAGGALPGDSFDGRLAATTDQQNPELEFEDGTFRMTDLVLQNPEGDAGLLSILRNDQPLLVVRLENFRDLDYHFVAPIVFEQGQTLRLGVTCQNPDPAKACTPAAYFSGALES
jgi:hypothetical protein